MLTKKIKSTRIGRLLKMQPSGRKLVPKKHKVKRVRKIFITMFATDFSISFRKFKTTPQNRTKLKKQVVYRIYGSRFKEVAITIEGTDLPPLHINMPRIPAPALATAMIVLGVSSALLFSLNLTSPQKLVPVAQSYAQIKPKPPANQPLVMAPSQPTRIHIDKVSIDAAVEPVSLLADGSLQVPNSPDLTGWYDKSPTPGELGPSIIDGHVDYIDNIAVFWRLRELLPGDIIEVSRADGTTAKFVVNKVNQYSQSNFPDTEVYGSINYAGLRLITCSGTFDSVTHHYSDNLVVFASLAK